MAFEPDSIVLVERGRRRWGRRAEAALVLLVVDDDFPRRGLGVAEAGKVSGVVVICGRRAVEVRGP